METTIVYWGYIGRMEEKMETTYYCGYSIEKYGGCVLRQASEGM